ncbi:MAG: HPP family protein [Thermoplasmata archaeon]|nr:MAG: HPP family protein [Thermoplasmata archaeon]
MKKTGKISKEELIYKAHKDKEKHVMDLKLRERGMWVHYLFQSLLATFSIFLVLLVLQLATPVIVAALGATAFVCFAMPKNITAQPRNVVGGHMVGVLSGGVCALLFISFGGDSTFIHIIFASLSVGVTIFIMVVTDTEHPPGCSTALGLVVHPAVPLDVALYGGFILISASIIAFVKHALDPKLKDLV